MTYRLMTLTWVAFVLTGIGVRIADAAPLLKVDFGESHGNPLQLGFSELAGSISQATAGATIGPYTVGLAGQGFEETSETAANALDPSIRGLFRDTYFNNSDVPGVGVSLSIGGVTPNANYNLQLWSYDAAQTFSSTPTQWAPAGSTTGTSGSITNFALPRPTTLDDYTTTIQVSSPTGTLEIFGTTTSGFGGTRLNGFRLNDGASNVLAVDFGQPAIPAAPVQTGFSGLKGLQYQATDSQAVGAYTVSVAGQGFEDASDDNANAMDGNVRDLFRGTYYNNSDVNGQGVTLAIEGVTPNVDYDVKLWSYDAAQFFSATTTHWGPTGDTSGASGDIVDFATPAPTTLDDYSTIIRVHSTSNTLHIFGTTTAGFGGTRLNAFQLSSVVEGDVNGDGIVNIFDINLVSAHWSESGPAGDANDDGTVNIFDINLISANWSAPGSGGGAAVPEPSSWVLLALGMGIWRISRCSRPMIKVY